MKRGIYSILLVVLMHLYVAHAETEWLSYGYGEERGLYAERLFGISFPADFLLDPRCDVIIPELRELPVEEEITKDDRIRWCLVMYNVERTLRVVANYATTQNFHYQYRWDNDGDREAVRAYLMSFFQTGYSLKVEDSYEVIWGFVKDGGLMAFYLAKDSVACQILHFQFLQGSSYENHQATVDRMLQLFRPVFYFLAQEI